MPSDRVLPCLFPPDLNQAVFSSSDLIFGLAKPQRPADCPLKHRIILPNVRVRRFSVHIGITRNFLDVLPLECSQRSKPIPQNTCRSCWRAHPPEPAELARVHALAPLLAGRSSRSPGGCSPAKCASHDNLSE